MGSSSSSMYSSSEEEMSSSSEEEEIYSSSEEEEEEEEEDDDDDDDEEEEEVFSDIEVEEEEEELFPDMEVEEEEGEGEVFTDIEVEEEEEEEEVIPDMEFYCAICMEVKSVEEMFKNENCCHSFCDDCVGSYLTAKIQQNISTVKCPDPKCSAVLEPHQCSSIIPNYLLDKWGNALCNEFKGLKEGDRGREDLLTIELVKNKGWKRCPSCKFYVEKIGGCSHITCRCGYDFCYDSAPLG